MAVRFAILGPLQVEVDGVARTLGSPRQRAILGLLLLNANQVVTADTLNDAVWGDDAADGGSAALQVHVSRLRSALGLAAAGGPLVTQDPGYLVRATAESLDLLAFGADVAEARRLAAAGDHAGAATRYRTALDRWRGRALADVEGIARIDLAADQLEVAKAEASMGWVEAELRAGHHAAVLADLGRLVAEHPYDERLRALQMTALYRAGRQTDALATYRELRRVLDEDLGLEPGPDLVALELQILRHDPGIAAPEAPGTVAAPGSGGGPAPDATGSARPARERLLHVPVATSELIGRETDVTDVTALLRDHRLVTLTGPGGTGKTRLAIEVARVLDGALGATCFVDLSGTRDADLVPDTILAALELGSESGRPAVEQLVDVLSDGPTVLVLDNMEQVLGSATVIARLLGTAENLRILATSRSLLQIRGERGYLLAPLVVAAPDRPTAEIAESAAVRLFVERARDAGATLAVTDASAPRLAAICARLDGLPLAIELAAVRARLLGSDELLERLGGRLALLTGGSRDLPDRQQTLRATIDWSHELLDPRQAMLFRRLAVFAGGFTLEAAGAACADQADDLLDDLEALVVHSLVRRVGGEDGPARFAFLETIREYANEQLERSGEAETIARRHAGFLVDFAEAGRVGLRGPDALAWTTRLNAERDNLHAALAWSLATGESELGLRLAAALREWWEVTGRLEDGRLWLDRLLATNGPRGDDVEAAALNATGGLAFHQADLDRAEAAFGAALVIRQRLGDTAGIAGCLGNLSSIASTRGDVARAIELQTESLATWREVGDPWGIAVALGNLGQDVAEELFDLVRSAELLDEAVALFRQVGDARGLAWVLTSAGTVDIYRGDAESAATKLHEALALARRLGAPNETAIALRSLGELELRRGDIAMARARLLEAAALFLDSDELGDVAADLELLGEVLRAEGSIADAVRTWGCAAALRDQVGAPSNARDRASFKIALEDAAAEMGRVPFTAALEAGRASDARTIVAGIAASAPASASAGPAAPRRRAAVPR